MAVFVTNCPHCHTANVSFSLKWSYVLRPYEQIAGAVCGACRFAILIQFLGGSGAVADYSGDLRSSNFSVVEVWPKVTELGAPLHTPANVERRFIEGEDAFQRRRWNSAVAMYRSALDISTKAFAGVPAGLTFYKRLIWLHENHLITEQMKDWADHVRVEGNEALHDPEDFEEEDAAPLRLFTETFLRYVYELPGEVERFRASRDDT